MKALRETALIPYIPMITAIPAITGEQMRRVDQIATARFGLQLIQMMENAGRHLAFLTLQGFLGQSTDGKCVCILAGSGANGGGALIAARRLANWGIDVRVILNKGRTSFRGVPAHQLELVLQLGIPVYEELNGLGKQFNPDVIIDGLIGYGLIGCPNEKTSQLIAYANGSGIPIISLDIPSGMDSTSGTVSPLTITAAATLTLALPKKVLLLKTSAHYVGELYLADVGISPRAYEEFGIEEARITRLFTASDLVQIKG